MVACYKFEPGVNPDSRIEGQLNDTCSYCQGGWCGRDVVILDCKHIHHLGCLLGQIKSDEAHNGLTDFLDQNGGQLATTLIHTLLENGDLNEVDRSLAEQEKIEKLICPFCKYDITQQTEVIKNLPFNRDLDERRKQQAELKEIEGELNKAKEDKDLNACNKLLQFVGDLRGFDDNEIGKLQAKIVKVIHELDVRIVKVDNSELNQVPPPGSNFNINVLSQKRELEEIKNNLNEFSKSGYGCFLEIFNRLNHCSGSKSSLEYFLLKYQTFYVVLKNKDWQLFLTEDDLENLKNEALLFHTELEFNDYERGSEFEYGLNLIKNNFDSIYNTILQSGECQVDYSENIRPELKLLMDKPVKRSSAGSNDDLESQIDSLQEELEELRTKSNKTNENSTRSQFLTAAYGDGLPNGSLFQDQFNLPEVSGNLMNQLDSKLQAVSDFALQAVSSQQLETLWKSVNTIIELARGLTSPPLKTGVGANSLRSFFQQYESDTHNRDFISFFINQCYVEQIKTILLINDFKPGCGIELHAWKYLYRLEFLSLGLGSEGIAKDLLTNLCLCEYAKANIIKLFKGSTEGGIAEQIKELNLYSKILSSSVELYAEQKRQRAIRGNFPGEGAGKFDNNLQSNNDPSLNQRTHEFYDTKMEENEIEAEQLLTKCEAAIKFLSTHVDSALGNLNEEVDNLTLFEKNSPRLDLLAFGTKTSVKEVIEGSDNTIAQYSQMENVDVASGFLKNYILHLEKIKQKPEVENRDEIEGVIDKSYKAIALKYLGTLNSKMNNPQSCHKYYPGYFMLHAHNLIETLELIAGREEQLHLEDLPLDHLLNFYEQLCGLGFGSVSAASSKSEFDALPQEKLYYQEKLKCLTGLLSRVVANRKCAQRFKELELNYRFQHIMTGDNRCFYYEKSNDNGDEKKLIEMVQENRTSYLTMKLNKRHSLFSLFVSVVENGGFHTVQKEYSKFLIDLIKDLLVDMSRFRVIEGHKGIVLELISQLVKINDSFPCEEVRDFIGYINENNISGSSLAFENELSKLLKVMWEMLKPLRESLKRY